MIKLTLRIPMVSSNNLLTIKIYKNISDNKSKRGSFLIRILLLHNHKKALRINIEVIKIIY